MSSRANSAAPIWPAGVISCPAFVVQDSHACMQADCHTRLMYAAKCVRCHGEIDGESDSSTIACLPPWCILKRVENRDERFGRAFLPLKHVDIQLQDDIASTPISGVKRKADMIVSTQVARRCLRRIPTRPNNIRVQSYDKRSPE